MDASRRLARKADFERLLREGARRNAAGYTFITARRAEGGARLGILISRRHAKAAVQRNGIKRCIREAFRLEHERLGPLDLLVRPPYGIKPSAKMISQLRALLGRLCQ